MWAKPLLLHCCSAPRPARCQVGAPRLFAGGASPLAVPPVAHWPLAPPHLLASHTRNQQTLSHARPPLDLQRACAEAHKCTVRTTQHGRAPLTHRLNHCGPADVEAPLGHAPLLPRPALLGLSPALWACLLPGRPAMHPRGGGGRSPAPRMHPWQSYYLAIVLQREGARSCCNLQQAAVGVMWV